MKIVFSFSFFLLFVASTCGKEKTYTGSTPADAYIRSFLGISLSDSVDFIRWELILGDKGYKLYCNYGVGKANTNGFINGGKTVELSGDYKKENNQYHFQNSTRTLKAIELNEDLLHLLGADNSLLVGNGGWSYTLNNLNPVGTNQISLTAPQTPIKDSISFEGRTPCNVPGVIAPGSSCYKLKWFIVLYNKAKVNEVNSYKILGTPWRQAPKTGTWKIIAGQDGRTIYQLHDEKGNGFLYFLKLDEHLLVFTDAGGKLLVGNEDFSYTLNHR